MADQAQPVVDKEDEVIDGEILEEEKDWNPTLEDVHGIKIVKESPQIVARGLELLRKRLEKDRAKRAKKGHVGVPEEVIADDAYLLKFLRVMKFDPKRTAHLVEKNWEYKVEVLGLAKKRIEPSDLNVDILNSGLVSLPGIRDKYGRRVAYVRARFLDHTWMKKEDILRIIWYCMETVTEDEETQKSGVILINDLADLSIANFDRALMAMIAEGIQKRLPIRIGAFFYVSAPSVFNVIWPIAQLFLSEKLKSRIRFLGSNFSGLEELFTKDQILIQHHGTFISDHDDWVKSVLGN